MQAKNRFEFGANWERFLSTIDENKIRGAEVSICAMLKANNFSGKSFLDAGCGSGLFSLAARRLGARVRSFDYDIVCVSCAEELKKRYLPGAADWAIEQGSVLDENYLNSLGQFDVVYSWGVLHHTGNMKKAIDLVAGRVNDKGFLFISLYNDQGPASRFWLRVKRLYNRLPRFLQVPMVALIAFPFEMKAMLFGYRHKKERGMSVWYDWVDWCGGLPFEVAKPDDVIASLKSKGFALENLKTTTGWGCNEFVFRRMS